MNDIAAIASNHGFALQEASSLPEIDGDAYVMRHDASGARLLYLRNQDPDKGFSISFKTPAADDTGVFHILEHSVLCGSEKFPVKEPFVNLIKTSMQTFLNAMTFPDKTMYPVSSTNEQDLMNLADVYLDAVFRPNIYSNRHIFEQEGWHYEVDDGQLLINGVVFNEMKGALSDPDSVLYDTLASALFPDTTYRFESGGTPDAIPTLTYEQFLANHAAHYRPDNSYIVLYGNLDIDRFLGFLDEEYLTPLSAEADALHSGASEPIQIGLQAPVVATGVKRDMATAPENACAAYGYVIGTAEERERLVAMSVVLDAIMGSNASPLKRALLDADIADDVDAYVADSIRQPYVMVYAKGLKDGDASVVRLGETIRTTITSLVEGGLDAELVASALSHAEFVMREGNFGYPDGVVLSMAALGGWLYEDTAAAATSHLRYEDVFASLRAKLTGSYFSDLLREVFLDNDHWAQAEVVPRPDGVTSALDEQIERVQASLDASEAEAIERNVEALRVAQETPDSPRALATLPRLSRDDIGDAPAEPVCRIEAEGPATVLRHEVETHGIVYATRYFDLRCVPFEDLPYVTVLAMALGKMDTADHTAAELDVLQQSKLGSLAFGIDVFEAPASPDAVRPAFTVAASALADNAECAATLANEILTTSRFHDAGKLLDILVQRKVALEQGFAMAGNSVAAARAASYYLPAGVVRERVQNIDFYVFLKGLIADFEERFQALADKLDELAALLFSRAACTLSFAGTDDDYRRYIDAGALAGVASGPAAPALVIPEPVDKAEAFIVPTDVTYTAVSADRRSLAGSAARFTGAWMLASRILTYSYLWNEVRVKGGAYGVSFTVSRPGSAAFTSYRDPHIDATVDAFAGAGDWLGSLAGDADEFDGYVVSTAANFDKPLKPRDLVRRQALMYFTDYAREEFVRCRSEVIAATPDDVCALGPAITALAGERHWCVVGNKDVIDQTELPLNAVDLLAL